MKKLFGTPFKNEDPKDNLMDAFGVIFLLLVAVFGVPGLGQKLMHISPILAQILAAIIVLIIVFGTIILIVKSLNEK